MEYALERGGGGGGGGGGGVCVGGGGGGGGRERERKGEKTFSLAASFSLLSHLFVAKENLYLYLYL